MKMKSRNLAIIAAAAAAALSVGLLGCGDKTASGNSTTPTATAKTEKKGDLAAVKDYTVGHAADQKGATAALLANAEKYYEIIKAANFDYQAAWNSRGPELKELLAEAKANWMAASTSYELAEGIVAGVPSLAYYDTWIDAGPSAAEDPVEALDWQLPLPDGRVLDKPGNFFSHLTEPALWGTVSEFTGLKVDLNGNGKNELGEVLPEANVLVAATRGLDKATGEMSAAIDAWKPTMEDAFTALVTMIPTMNEYFEQWKLSSFVNGDVSQQTSFVAMSRLFDITGILYGLDVTYDNVGSVVAAKDAQLHSQIDRGFDELVSLVDDLYQKEKAGTKFTPEEADTLGVEAQDKAQALAALVAQAATKLNLKLEV